MASGTIEATEVAASFKIPGRVIERPVDEGDRVAPGALIARLESRELESEVDRLRASLRATQTRLPQLQTEITLQEELTRARIAEAQAALAAQEERLAELGAVRGRRTCSGPRPMSARPRPCWITPRPISSAWKRCTARVEFRAQTRDSARTSLDVAVERHKNAVERSTSSGKAHAWRRCGAPRPRSARLGPAAARADGRARRSCAGGSSSPRSRPTSPATGPPSPSPRRSSATRSSEPAGRRGAQEAR